MPLTEKQKEAKRKWRKKNPHYTMWYKKHRPEILLRGKQVNEQLKLERGGRCDTCGYNKDLRALTWHHKDPQNKKYAMSTLIRSCSTNKLREEAKKCILLCANCHMILHGNQHAE